MAWYWKHIVDYEGGRLFPHSAAYLGERKPLLRSFVVIRAPRLLNRLECDSTNARLGECELNQHPHLSVVESAADCGN